MSYVGNKPAQTTIPADDAVTTAMLKDDAVTSAKIDDGTIATADIADDAVTVDKVANAINTSIAANTAKVTNATHTGDVTGATALTIAVDAVDIAMLSATGTASSSTFLRGDNAWSAAGGGFNSLQVFTSSGTWTRPSDITKVVMHVVGAGGAGGGGRVSYNYAGQGGAAGGTAIKFLDVSSISTSTITVAAVVSGPAADVDGSDGGASSWADGTNTVTGSGGEGGRNGGNNISQAGGAASGGDINSPGAYGDTGGPGGNIGSQDSGPGAVCANGFGGGPGASNYDVVSNHDAYGYGHGGGGGAKGKAGGDSAGGIIVVWEYK